MPVPDRQRNGQQLLFKMSTLHQRRSVVNDFRMKAKITNLDIERIFSGTKFKDCERNKIIVEIAHDLK